MHIFNSLGSNYNLAFVLKTLFSINQNKQRILEQFLEDKYRAKATLLYKGREAIELGLRSFNLPPDSFVAINGFTCFAVFEAIEKAGLQVEYLDIEKGELNFSPKELEKHLEKNPKIKSVIIQNTLGYPCQVEQISKICEKYNLILIEDLAHSVGTTYKSGSEAGTMGDVVVLSFSQDKMIDGISGGALIKKGKSNIHLRGVPTKKQIIDRLYPLFTYLIRSTYFIYLGKIIHFLLKSFKLLSEPMHSGDEQIHNLPSWYCSLINLSFSKLSENLIRRRKIASLYAKLINRKILSPKILRDINLSSNLRFPIFVDNRQSLIRFLKSHQIHISDIWYDAPIAPKKYLTQTDYANQCPNAKSASEEILNLPTHINISEKDAQNIAQLVNQWIKN